MKTEANIPTTESSPTRMMAVLARWKRKRRVACHRGTYKWDSQLKIAECSKGWSTSMPDAYEKIFKAVISGEVRARYNARVFGPEWLKIMAKYKADDDDPFALPPDVEISVTDIERVFEVE